MRERQTRSSDRRVSSDDAARGPLKRSARGPHVRSDGFDGRVEACRSARVSPRETNVIRRTWCMDMMVAVTHITPVIPSVAGSWNIVVVHPRHTPKVGTPTRVLFRSGGPG